MPVIAPVRRLARWPLLLLLLWPRPAFAQDKRAPLDIIVNQVKSGESIVILRGSDVLVRLSALADAGLEKIGGIRVDIGGEPHVSLASVAPDVTFEIDEGALQLRLTVSPDLLGTRVDDLLTGAPAGLVYRSDTSAFLNYAVNYNTRSGASIFAESVANVRGAAFYNTLTSTRESTVRGLTSVSVDDRARMRRWTFGDGFSYTGPLGGEAWLAGITVDKEFAIDPYFVRFPTLSLSTPITVPSVLEVRVNGQVVREEQVAPGRLDVQNLPLTLGRNDARLVVRDAFGVTREVTSDFYVTTTALAKGLQDYHYSVGWERRGMGARSWDYRNLVALARHRIGLSDMVTAGGRVEIRPGRMASGGPSFNVRLPFGDLEAAAAASRRDTTWGRAAQLGFTYASRPVSAGGSVMVASRHYATVSDAVTVGKPAMQSTVFASVSVASPVTVTLQHSLTRVRDGLTRSRSGVLSTVRVRRNMELTASVSHVREGKTRRLETFAGVTLVFGHASATISRVRDGRGSRMAMDAQQSLPAGQGYGYQLRSESGPSGAVTGVAQYQNQLGRYEVRQESVGGQASTTISAMGSVVGIGGGVYAARPVRGSFALVRVPGVEGVRAFASHQEVGRTGRGGDVLVPDLQAYYGNLLDIADTDVPLTYAIPKSKMILAPPYRGGALALFEVEQVRQVVGRVVVIEAGVERASDYGRLTVNVNGTATESPIGSEGKFYFENLPAGRHTATVDDRNGRCSFQIEVPATAGAVIDLGLVRCTNGETEK